MKYQCYVVGFMFDNSMSNVALIRKNKPAWQAGLLNGIGGKIEPGEVPSQAMIREFGEETGCDELQHPFRHFAAMAGADFSVDLFATIGDVSSLQSPEDEQVEIIDVATINPLRSDMIENLPWLISLAIDHLTDGRPRWTAVSYP